MQLLHALFRFNDANLISEKCCRLEVQPVGSVVHLSALFLEQFLFVTRVGIRVHRREFCDGAFSCALDVADDVTNAFLNGLRRDVVLRVVGHLDGATTIGLADGTLHRARVTIRIQKHAAVHVACRAAYGLDERGFRAEKAFFVGVEYADKLDFRKIPRARRTCPCGNR